MITILAIIIWALSETLPLGAMTHSSELVRALFGRDNRRKSETKRA